MTTSQQTSASPQGRPLSPALDKTFKIGLVLKGLDGVLEVTGGILLLLLTPHAIEHVVRVLTAHERARTRTIWLHATCCTQPDT